MLRSSITAGWVSWRAIAASATGPRAATGFTDAVAPAFPPVGASHHCEDVRICDWRHHSAATASASSADSQARP
jgi:hypothetical protein